MFFHFFQNDMTKMVRSSEILMSAVIMSILLDIKWKKHDIWKVRNKILKINKNLLFCWYQQIKIHCVQVFKLIWNDNYLSKILLSFSSIPPLEAKSYRRQLKRYENRWCQQTLFSNFWKNLWLSIYLSLFVVIACLY